MSCSRVLLVLIDSTWHNYWNKYVSTSQGNRQDWVLREIEIILNRGDVPIWPILLDDAKMPEGFDLPESIKKLKDINAIRFRKDTFNDNVDALVNKLLGLLNGDAEQRIDAKRTDNQRTTWAGKTLAALFATILVSAVFLQIYKLPTIGPAENLPPAEDLSGTFIVMDALGDMWSQMNGIPKIETMRNAINQMVRHQLHDEGEVGLIAFGHNKQNDCEDIEVLVPLQKLNRKHRENLLGAVYSIVPQGKSPIAQTIKFAAESLASQGKTGKIFLFSDGKDSCNQDPCAVVRELKEHNNLKIEISTVAFNIADEKGKQQLMCIAKEGGGTFFIADKPSQLNKAIEKFAAKVNQSVGLKLKVEGGELRGTELEWTILSLETETPRFVENYSGAVIRDIDPGEDEIFVRGLDANVFGSVRVEVKPDVLTVATVPIKRDEKKISIVGEGEIPAGSKIEFNWDFGGNNGDLIYIMVPDTPDWTIEKDEQKIFRGGASDKKQLPVPTSPREYELRYYDSEKEIIIARETFTVGPPGI